MSTIVTIHISESGTIKNRATRTAIISALVVPYNHRKEVKEEVKTAIERGGIEADKRIIKWTKVSPKEQHIYMNVLTALNNDDLVKYYAVKIRNFEYYKIMPAYIQLIKAVKRDYPDAQVRVFVQANEGKSYNRMAMLKEAVKKANMEIDINQAPITESRFIQCADLIGGAVLFFTRDDMYLEKLGMPGKATVVEHGLNLKKKNGKFNLLEFKEA